MYLLPSSAHEHSVRPKACSVLLWYEEYQYPILLSQEAVNIIVGINIIIVDVFVTGGHRGEGSGD